MKQLLCALLITLALPYGLEGQERRLLTMEETILSRELVPENINTFWGEDVDGKTVYAEARSRENINWYYPKSGKAAEAAAPARHNKPRYFTEANNLFVEYNGEKRAITNESDTNIVSGSHVSRNEFGIMGGIFPSPDGESVAFYQKDESLVTDFPLLDITTRTGSLVETKYAMAGMDSERVKVGVWSLESEEIVWLNVTDFDEERYLTNITWSPDGELIYIQVLNRDQNEMHLNSYSATTGEQVEHLFTDSDPRYVEPFYPLRWVDESGNRFIYATNVRDGYWNLYLYERKKEGAAWSHKRLTEVDADVKFVELKGDWVYYYSAEFSTAEQHLCKVSIKNGKQVRLTHAPGWHNCLVSPDGEWFLDNYSALKVPRVINLASTKKGEVVRNILTAADPTEGYNYTEIELGTIPTADGKWENWYRLIYPLDFDPSKKYPAIVYVYGGPHSQMVNNSFLAQLRRWEMYMAQRGYVVFVMDNRGTEWHGAEYEKAIHRQCGKCEMEDQMKGVEWLTSHEWVDADRIGVHGWSYGGFMTISLMTHYPEVFKVGVAGGPVIDWKWYEIMYGERYMDTPEQNPEGYEATSLINQAQNLKGKLLICQGAIDPVVLWQHSLSFVRACVVNNVQVDYFPYPRHEHNVLGRDRVHLMDKVTMYFDDYLK